MNKTTLTLTTLLVATGSGCIIPPEQPPSVSPGSPASIGGTRPAVAAPVTAAPKDCGAGALIEDGEDGNNQSAPAGGRGGYWYTFRDAGTTTVEPAAGKYGGPAFTMSDGGHASSWAARFHGKIGSGAIVYAGLGVNFIDPKGQYDASKYTGVTFWARRAENSTGKVRLKVPDVNTDEEAKVCTECFNDFGADFTFGTEWKQYVVPFASMKQLAGWGAPRKPHIESGKVYGLQWQIQVPGASYDIFIDDVRFLCE